MNITELLLERENIRHKLVYETLSRSERLNLETAYIMVQDELIKKLLELMVKEAA